MTEQAPKKLDEVLPEWEHTQDFVAADNPFMARALALVAEMRKEHPEVAVPAAAVVVKEGIVLAAEKNGDAHTTFCPRKALGSKSGTEYEFCPDHCHSSNHAEATVARVLTEKGIDAHGGELYLAGHYWACMPCWEAMRSVGITKLHLLEGAQDEFKKNRTAGVLEGGKFPRPLEIKATGAVPAELTAALAKVNITLTPGSSEGPLTLVVGGKNFDYSNSEDYRQILVRLSRDLEPFVHAK